MEAETRISRPKATKQIFYHLSNDAGFDSGEAIRIADKLVKHFTKRKTETAKPKITSIMQAFVDNSEIDIDGLRDYQDETFGLDEAISDGGWQVMAEESCLMAAYLNEGVYDADYGAEGEILKMEKIW